MKKEIWKAVPSYEGLYASNLGRIKTDKHYANMPNGSKRSYSVKPTYGYEDKKSSGRNGVPKRRIVRIRRYNKSFKIARLVCEAFHGKPSFDKAVTIHLDEDPSNNRPENLKWGTQKENLNMPKIKQWHKNNVCNKFKYSNKKD